MDEIEEDDTFDKGDKKYRIVKYHKHGILRKAGENWVFDSRGDVQEFYTEDTDITLIDLLDDLSKDGYALVGVDGGNYILRNEDEIEEIEGYWDTNDIDSV